ncbi:MAG: AN1-type zinc finger protein [Methanoregula sp.]|nr:AN1-type zinc finger protein [Methanoregula sp.]
MTRCDHCRNEVVLPFSCQYCGGKYCPDCRLPPNHTCVNIGLWNSKPRPAAGIAVKKTVGATPAGSGYIADLQGKAKKKVGAGTPYIKIMMAIIVLILLGIAWLVFSRYHTG